MHCNVHCSTIMPCHIDLPYIIYLLSSTGNMRLCKVISMESNIITCCIYVLKNMSLSYLKLIIFPLLFECVNIDRCRRVHSAIFGRQIYVDMCHTLTTFGLN